MGRLKISILFLPIIIFLVLTFGDLTFAQRDLEVGYPEIGGVRPESTIIGLPEYIKYIFNFSLAISGLVIFSVLVYAGFRYLSSGGKPAARKDAKDRIFAALLGIAVLLGSYLILTTINPQLVFLKLPDIEFLQKEQSSQQPFPEKDTLAYSEIPIGGLIGELFFEGRLDRIKDISDNIQKISGDVFNKSQELVLFSSQCACSLAQPDCGGGCSGGFCKGEPCPARSEINQKRGELQLVLSGSKASLEDWREKMNIEINGSSAGAGEKIIGFQKVSEDLKKAEEEIKNCPFNKSKAGRPQILLSYSDFWEYRNKLEEEQKIKGVEAERQFDYISPDSPYYLATFYCAEFLEPILAGELSEVSLSEEYIAEIEKNIPETVVVEESTCGPEITIGQTIDNAQELANKILAELNDVNNNVPEEINSARNLIELANPAGCSAGSCQSQCAWIEQQCWESEPCPEEELPTEEPPEANLWDRLFSQSHLVFAQEPKDCGKWVNCSYCDIQPCSGSVCPGDPTFSSRMGANFSGIQAIVSGITNSQKNIKNIIEEIFKTTKILENLDSAQKEIGACYNSKEARKKAEGGQRVTWEELNSCSTIRQSIGGVAPFYDENGQELEDCYGPIIEEPGLMDNFFCCQSELFKQ